MNFVNFLVEVLKIMGLLFLIFLIFDMIVDTLILAPIARRRERKKAAEAFDLLIEKIKDGKEINISVDEANNIDEEEIEK